MLFTEERETVSIDPRYVGLPGVAHGGYSSGVLAAAVGTRGVEVKLRRPVRVSRPLTRVHANGGHARLLDGDTVLAEAAPTELELRVPRAPTLEQASEAATRYPGVHGHPYPDCFACGPDRHDGHGLRIFPGAVHGRPLVAAPWIPPGAADGDPVPLELIWAAFDCAQLWALMVHQRGRHGERAVTASLTGTVERPVRAGVPHVVFAWPLGREGGALRAGAALVDAEGELAAVGVQTAVIAKWGVPLDFMRRPKSPHD